MRAQQVWQGGKVSPKFPVVELQSRVAGPVAIAQVSAQALVPFQGEQAIGQAIGEIGKRLRRREEQDDVSNLDKQLSQAQADFTTQFNTAFEEAGEDADAGKISADLIKGFEDHVATIKENVNTRAGDFYFQKHSQNIRNNLVNTAAAGQARLVGARAVSNISTSLNNRSTTLLNDPSQLDSSIEAQNEAIDGHIGPGFSRADATKLKAIAESNLAKSAIRGFIRIDPVQAQKDLEANKWAKLGVTGDTSAQLFSEASQEIRRLEIEAGRLKKESEDLKKERDQVIQNDFLDKLVENKLTTRDIRDSALDPFGSGSKNAFLALLQSQNSGTNRTDPVTHSNLFQRIHLPDGDPNKILNENDLNEFVGVGITMEDLNGLRKEIQGSRTTAGKNIASMKQGVINQAKNALIKENPLLGISDPAGHENFNKFNAFFLEEFARKRKEGIPAKDLLTPGNKEYLGDVINNYQKSPQEIIKSFSQGFKSKTPPMTVPSKPTKPIGERLKELLGEVF